MLELGSINVWSFGKGKGFGNADDVNIDDMPASSVLSRSSLLKANCYWIILGNQLNFPIELSDAHIDR